MRLFKTTLVKRSLLLAPFLLLLLVSSCSSSASEELYQSVSPTFDIATTDAEEVDASFNDMDSDIADIFTVEAEMESDSEPDTVQSEVATPEVTSTPLPTEAPSPTEAPTATATPTPTPSPTEEPLAVESYSIASQTTQIIDVIASGSYGTLTLYNKDDDVWSVVLSVSCRVGKNGISYSHSEGDGTSPAGVYSLGQAFGIASNPGSTRSYLQVTSDYYWVDDSDSVYYNQLVNASETGIEWTSAEHLVDYTTAYKYAIAINYNTSCTPGAGSAIFLHCATGNATNGCVSVSESDMITILQSLRSDTLIYIH